MPRKRTQDEFVTEATQKHNGYYNYEKSIYTNKETKVIITCPVHGDFEQHAGSHLRGHGCIKCFHIEESGNAKDFIKRAEKVHQNRFTYEKVVYKNSYTPVTVTCKIHGDFKMSPHAILKGRGCQKCGGTEALTTKIFIERSTKKHNGKFRYDKTVYKTANEKVTIFCTKCNRYFEQLASAHLAGSGCRFCVNHKFNLSKPSMLYVIQTNGFVGYGISNTKKARLRTHARNINGKFNIEAIYTTPIVSGEDAVKAEKSIAENFYGFHTNANISGFINEAIVDYKRDDLLSYIQNNIGKLRVMKQEALEKLTNSVGRK